MAKKKAASSKSDKGVADPHGVYGKTFAIFGEFHYWPAYHGCTPSQRVQQLGGSIRNEVSETLDYLVFGEKRGPGKAEAKKKAESLVKKNEKHGTPLPLRILNEAEFRAMLREDITGRSFSFAGGFDCCPGGDNSLLKNMTLSASAVVHDEMTPTTDYLVMGARRAAGKAASEKAFTSLRQSGSAIKQISEEHFLELVRVEHVANNNKQGASTGSLDFSSFVGNLFGLIDKRKADRAMKMLKSEKHQLYSKLDEASLIGIVRSQTSESVIYVPWINSEGKYGCCDGGLGNCMGQQDRRPCKHLLVLLIGLTHAGKISPELANSWMQKTAGKGPRKNDDFIATVLLEYKGAQAGEFDWRPTETVPEDYYAF